MKLTLAFLAALAAADAAEARSSRHARRQYGSGYGTGPAYGSVESSKVPEAAVSSSAAVPYVQSSAEAFKTSSPPDAASSYPPTEATPAPPAGGAEYGSGYGEVPVGGAGSSAPAPAETPAVPSGGVASPSPSPAPSSSKVPEAAVSSSAVAPPAGGDYGNGYGTPSKPSSSPAVSSKVPEAETSGTPSGVYPTSPAVPSGGVGKPSSSPAVPVGANSTPGVYPSGGAEYPTGTGAALPSTTPMSDYVTKTIYSTQITYESSALVTKTVAVSTTVCAEDEAVETPMPSKGQVTSEVPVSEVVKTMTETLVYTVGVGSTAHPVTTEVVSTSTSTVYSTLIITVGGEKPTKPAGGEYPVATPEGGKPGKPEGPTGTSTLTSTQTSTKYITVKPTPTGSVPVGQEGYPVGGADKPAGDKPAGSNGGEDCAVPVTVTVTAKETVTVTAGEVKPTAPAAEKPTGYPTAPEVPAGGAGKPTMPSAAPSGGMYPINNGTNPYPAGPTGFQTSTKPSVPVGTVVPSKPAETSLPAFSFVSEAATPVKTPSVETGAPAASSPAAYPAYPAAPSSKVPEAETSAKATPTPAGGDYGNAYPAYPVAASSKVPEAETSAKATPTPAAPGSGYGSGYGTY